MNGDNLAAKTAMVLSHEEVLAVLDVLQARSIPGLDAAYTQSWTEQQRQMVLETARHGLQARALASLRDDNVLLVHRALLTTVGSCAYSHSAVVLYHWGANRGDPDFFAVHVRGNDIVLHDRPNPFLHHFTLLPSRDDLFDRLLETCEYLPRGNGLSPVDLTLSGQAFSESRQLAEAGEHARASERLLREGVDPAGAEAFARTFAASPRVTVIQTLKQRPNEAIEERQATLVQAEEVAWLLTPVPTIDGATFRVRTVDEPALRETLRGWV